MCTITSRHQPYGLLHPLEVPDAPWTHILLDFITDLLSRRNWIPSLLSRTVSQRWLISFPVLKPLTPLRLPTLSSRKSFVMNYPNRLRSHSELQPCACTWTYVRHWLADTHLPYSLLMRFHPCLVMLRAWVTHTHCLTNHTHAQSNMLRYTLTSFLEALN
jgi:hypothetical protein